MRKFRGDTVSGIIVITDGGLNAGAGYESIIQAAKDAGGRKGAHLKIYTVGVGSTKPQPNLRIANLEAPTQVHTKDKFEIIARLQGQNLEGKEVEVILKAQYDEAGSLSTPREVARKTITLGKDGVAEKVSFEQALDETANLRYTVEANLLDPVAELKLDDNVKSANVVDQRSENPRADGRGRPDAGLPLLDATSSPAILRSAGGRFCKPWTRPRSIPSAKTSNWSASSRRRWRNSTARPTPRTTPKATM